MPSDQNHSTLESGYKCLCRSADLFPAQRAHPVDLLGKSTIFVNNPLTKSFSGSQITANLNGTQGTISTE